MFINDEQALDAPRLSHSYATCFAGQATNLRQGDDGNWRVTMEDQANGRKGNRF